jgi:hypothetical protein
MNGLTMLQMLKSRMHCLTATLPPSLQEMPMYNLNKSLQRLQEMQKHSLNLTSPHCLQKMEMQHHLILHLSFLGSLQEGINLQ